MLDLHNILPPDGDSSQESMVKFFQQLIEVAEKGKHPDFEYLVSLDDYRVACYARHGIKKIYKQFQQFAKAAYNMYIEEAKQGIDDLKLLFDYRTYKKCAKFFWEEYDLVDDSIYEYCKYIHYSPANLFCALVGLERPEYDLEDYSGIGLAKKNGK